MMKRLLIALVVATVMTGCSGKTEEVNVTIIKVVKEDPNSNWGCPGTNVRTIYKSDAGHIGYMCGDYGDTGDTFKMYWVTGAFDPSHNGFRRTN